MTQAGGLPARDIPERALTLTSPWWWFMLCLSEPLRKPLENRSVGFSHKSFRGPVWVHAGAAASMSRVYYIDAVHFAIRRGVSVDLVPSFEWFRANSGRIVGRFTITDMLPAPYVCQLPDGWRMPDCVAFVTVDPVALAKPVPCKGALGFWKVPAPVLEMLRRAE